MMVEGYWRKSERKSVVSFSSSLPWPVATTNDHSIFLAALEQVEKMAIEQAFRGWSNCRLCQKTNGSTEFSYNGWRWPQGFRHYVAAHGVDPTPEFQLMIHQATRDPYPW
jgi:hypothetical protein